MNFFNYIVHSQTKLKFKDIIKVFIFIIFEFFSSSKKKNCDVCDVKDFEIIGNNFSRIADKKIYIEDKKNLLLSCTNCGTICQSKRYSNFFNYFFLNIFYDILMPQDKDPILVTKAKRRSEILNKILLDKKINKILEISSHDGSTLYEIKKRLPKSEFYGIEPVKNVAEGSQKKHKFLKNKITCSLAETYDFAKYNHTYDVVLFSHAFRMINFPNKFIEKLKKFLSKDSLIIVDEGGLIDTAKIDPIEYQRGLRTQKVNYFTFDSLSFLFEKNGFKEIFREDHLVLESENKSLNHYNSMLVFKINAYKKFQNKNKLNSSKKIILEYLKVFNKFKDDYEILYKI
jgi:hypothetical protein